MFARFLLLVTLAVLVVAVVARTSSGHGPERVYVVRPMDTLWSIATASYEGDPREAIWRIQRRNRLDGTLLRPGEQLVLP